LEIYNIAGRRVATLVDERLEANSYLIEWNGTDYNGQSVASGVYLYRLDAGQYVETKKMILLK
ncbi:MAG: T9SS type A sorting domain-containing protein, partial [candidate division Zixibacteria bacterium]|nr:T9SS type A sorting domain-containing protein [candidate division Zixibacteria bacterium]